MMTTEYGILREENHRLREQLLEARRTPAIPEAAIRAVWEHGFTQCAKSDRPRCYFELLWSEHADEVGRIFAEALKRG